MSMEDRMLELGQTTREDNGTEIKQLLSGHRVRSLEDWHAAGNRSRRSALGPQDGRDV